ncbi:10211_t:CDS:1 [Gigaspora rosea]|nr:10211_t:CDS:1 [Gigaspora rosea]
MVEQIRSKERVANNLITPNPYAIREWKKVESKWAMDFEDQFGKVKKWNNLTNKVSLQRFKQNMESGKLTPCKGCEISLAKTKTKYCFMERDISKL